MRGLAGSEGMGGVGFTQGFSLMMGGEKGRGIGGDGRAEMVGMGGVGPRPAISRFPLPEKLGLTLVLLGRIVWVFFGFF